jgi:hypothetical protein
MKSVKIYPGDLFVRHAGPTDLASNYWGTPVDTYISKVGLYRRWAWITDILRGAKS